MHPGVKQGILQSNSNDTCNVLREIYATTRLEGTVKGCFVKLSFTAASYAGSHPNRHPNSSLAEGLHSC